MGCILISISDTQVTLASFQWITYSVNSTLLHVQLLKHWEQGMSVPTFKLSVRLKSLFMLFHRINCFVLLSNCCFAAYRVTAAVKVFSICKNIRSRNSLLCTLSISQVSSFLLHKHIARSAGSPSVFVLYLFISLFCCWTPTLPFSAWSMALKWPFLFPPITSLCWRV